MAQGIDLTRAAAPSRRRGAAVIELGQDVVVVAAVVLHSITEVVAGPVAAVAREPGKHRNREPLAGLMLALMRFQGYSSTVAKVLRSRRRDRCAPSPRSWPAQSPPCASSPSSQASS